MADDVSRRAVSQALVATSSGSRPKLLLMTTIASAYTDIVGRATYKLMPCISVDGMTRKADGEFGLVVHNGTNLRYTDLAPGARAPMVCE